MTTDGGRNAGDGQVEVLVFPLGSSGDVHPFLGLALALKARGHRVTFIVNGYFRDLVERTGLEMVELGTREEFLSQLGHPDLWRPLRAFAHIMNHGIEPVMRRQYDEAARRYAPGRTLAIAGPIGIGVRMAQEKLGLPLVTANLQPAPLWSDRDPPVLPGMLPGSPRWLRRLQYTIGVRLLIDPVARRATEDFRRELRLDPLRKITRWWHSPDSVLCLFPAWFGPPQPDWPPQVTVTQFPLWDEDAVHPPQPEVEEFLAGRDPPVVFTPGSAHTHASAFFEAAAEACRILGRRGVLLTRFGGQVPKGLPPSVRHFDYVPFGRLLPRAAAIVHHGGIGTTAQGLRAGIPQLIMPLAHDQPDNAARVRRLGVGDQVPPARFRGPRVARVLKRLLESAEVKRSCARVAERFIGVDPFAEACAAVEELAARRRLRIS